MSEDVLSGLPDFDADLDTQPSVEEDRLYKEIKDFFVLFLKTIRASQLYVQGNPLLHKFYGDLTDRLNDLWHDLPRLSFTIFESDIRWQNRPVYEGTMGQQENLAFQLYKDGIRRLEFLPGAEEDELRQFIEVLRLSKTLKDEEDDLLTLLWHCEFTHIQYEYIDVLGDEPPVPVADLTEQAGTELPTLPELEVTPELQTPTLREDFEPALYFLDEADIAHLQRELGKEWERPIKQDVAVAVLDQFEMGDEERRLEIIDMLRQMLPRILAEGDFVHVAFLLEELKSIAEAKSDETVWEQVESIIAELSQPIVLEQLVRVLEDRSVEPSSEALATLLNVLRPEAIVVLLQSVSSVTREEVGQQLIETLEKLAAVNPGMMADLVSSPDPRVAAEAARIAGRLEMVEAADAISSLLKRGEREVRMAAVAALVALRTSRAGPPLLKALDDSSREVRVAAARGLAVLKYGPGTQQLEAHIANPNFWDRDLTEQRAFFEAYALAAGEASARLLGRMLNGRRFLWFRYPSRLRACAARALGLVGGAEAAAALDKAERDRDPLVLNAVHAARRGTKTEEAG